MALWYARDKSRYNLYLFSSRKPKKCQVDSGILFDAYGEVNASFSPVAFERVFPKKLHLKPGKGPYRLKPLERA